MAQLMIWILMDMVRNPKKGLFNTVRNNPTIRAAQSRIREPNHTDTRKSLITQGVKTKIKLDQTAILKSGNTRGSLIPILHIRVRTARHVESHLREVGSMPRDLFLKNKCKTYSQFRKISKGVNRWGHPTMSQ